MKYAVSNCGSNKNWAAVEWIWNGETDSTKLAPGTLNVPKNGTTGTYRITVVVETENGTLPTLNMVGTTGIYAPAKVVKCGFVNSRQVECLPKGFSENAFYFDIDTGLKWDDSVKTVFFDINFFEETNTESGFCRFSIGVKPF